MGEIRIGLNSHELDVALAKVMVNTEIAMEDVDHTDQEADRVKQKVDTLKVESTRSYREILAAGRRTATLVRGLAVASGNAYQEIYASGIEIALLTAELLIDVATAESLTVVGAISAAAKIGTILALLRKARQLEQGKTEEAARTEGIITALSVFTYAGVPLELIYLSLLFIKFIGGFE